MNPDLDIRTIAPIETLAPRQKLLRPQFPLKECEFPGDRDETTCHLGGFVDDELVGIVSVYREDLPEIQQTGGYRFRALAVEEGLRGRDCGLDLLRAAEAYAQKHGARYLWANARVHVTAFYGKAGYAIGNNEFVVAGVGPHVIVRRDFARPE